MRRAKMFAPRRARSRPFRLLGFDTEDSGGVIIQACFYGESKAGVPFERCYHVDDLDTPEEVRRQAMRFLMQECRSRTEVRVAAVNLEYDAMNLAWPEFFTPDVWDVTLVRGRWIFARLKGTNVSFMELGNHMPQSVKTWGEILDCPKLEFAPRDREYCMRDAEIAFRGARLLMDLYGREGGEMRYTAPASALEIYQRRFQKDSFEPVEADRLAFYREAYCGGRTEVFHHGKLYRAMTAVDVKSMYPALMLEPLPDYETAVECAAIPTRGDYVADVTVTVPDCHVPVLHVRRDGKLLFPVGRFRGVYCRPELERAIDCGAEVDDVHRVVKFGASRPYLAEYVKVFYPLKEAADAAGNEALRRFYKTGLLNSLYGKFGTAGTIERLAWTDDERTIYDFVDEVPDPPAYANVIWSAWVTALGRVRLHEALAAVEYPVYCDTDGIVFAGKGSIAYGSGLGDWELKGRYSRGEFWRAKAYAMTGVDGTGNAVHVRGVSLDFADKIIEEAYVEFSAPLRFREAIRRGERPNTWTVHKKTLDRTYDKRVVLRGGRTEPLRVWI